MVNSGHLVDAHCIFTVITCVSSKYKMMDDINWDLCCICQLSKNGKLTKPRIEGLITLGRDLNDFKEFISISYVCQVSFDQLNDGSGITATLISNNVKYHKLCRSYCHSSRVNRLHQNRKSAQGSPKKLRTVGKSDPSGRDVKG